MATGIDKWLRGLEDLAELDAEDLDKRVTDLRAQADVLQLKIGVLEQLLARARKRSRRGRFQAVVGGGAAAAPVAPVGNGTRTEPAVEGERPASWKREAVMNLLSQEPTRIWTAAEVKTALNVQGVMQGDEGTPTRLLLRRLAERGEITKLGTAKYSVVPPPSLNFDTQVDGGS